MAATEDVPQSLIPGLEEEAALLCLARVPRAYHKTLRQVCHQWRQLVDYPGTPPVKRRPSSCDVATLPALQLEPAGEPSGPSTSQASSSRWELRPHSMSVGVLSGGLTLFAQPNTAFPSPGQQAPSGLAPEPQGAEVAADAGFMGDAGSLRMSATAPLSATSSVGSMNEGQGDLEGHVQKRALYQVRRLEGIAETWIYLRTRTSSFVNHWRYFDVTNGVWAPRLPEIPYIAAAVAERTAGLSPYSAAAERSPYSPYSTRAERSPCSGGGERGASTPQPAVPWSSSGWQASPKGSPLGSPMTRPVGEMNKVRGLGSAAVGRRIYVFGGWREGGPALTDMFCYDAVTERWSRRAQMLTPRCYMATAVIGNRIYVAGGMTRPRLHLSELLVSAEYYDADTDRWHTLPDMPSPLFFTFAVELNGKLYVSGNGIQTALDGADPGRGCILDPVSCAWTLMRDQRLGDAILSPCAAVGKWLLAVCGNCIQVMDSESGEWFLLSVRQPGTGTGIRAVTGAGTGAVSGAVTGAAMGSGPRAGAVIGDGPVAGEGGASAGEATRAWAETENRGCAAAAEAAAKRRAAAAAKEAASSVERALLASALKDCVYAGRLSGVEGGGREGGGKDGDVCSLALLQRSGAITRVDVQFLRLRWEDDIIDWGAHCEPSHADVAHASAGSVRCDMASLETLRSSRVPLPVHPQYTRVCTVCFDTRPGEGTPQGYGNDGAASGEASGGVGSGGVDVSVSGWRGKGRGAGGRAGEGWIEIPFVTRVTPISKGPPLDDEQPVNIALVSL